MNDTYQHPGRWHDVILVPILSRYDATHFVMSYTIKKLDHNSVYEAMIQARNIYGWNEVRAFWLIHLFHKGTPDLSQILVPHFLT